MMSISSVGNTSAALSQAFTGDAVAITMLKKTLEVQSQSALQLLQALPLPTTNSPPNLGNSVNTFA
jgi:Putative motility protein